MYQGEAFIGRDSMKGCAQKAQLSFHITCKIYFHMKARLVSEKVGIAHSSWQFLVFFLICYFFSCFLGALQMTNANIREINLTPHTGRLKVSSTNWEQRYTVNTLSKQSQYCLFVCWKGFEKKNTKSTLKIIPSEINWYWYPIGTRIKGDPAANSPPAHS